MPDARLIPSRHGCRCIGLSGRFTDKNCQAICADKRAFSDDQRICVERQILSTKGQVLILGGNAVADTITHLDHGVSATASLRNADPLQLRRRQTQ
jgi:hypothetical protein